MAATKLVPPQLVSSINATLADLRDARAADPGHNIAPGKWHAGCDVCICQRRLDWLCDQLPRSTEAP